MTKLTNWPEYTTLIEPNLFKIRGKMLLLCEAKYWGPVDFFTGRVPCQEQILGSDIFLGEDLLLYGTA